MKNENNHPKKGAQPTAARDKAKKKKSTLAAEDKIRSATGRVNPESHTGLSRGLADTGTNVSYEEEE